MQFPLILPLFASIFNDLLTQWAKATQNKTTMVDRVRVTFSSWREKAKHPLAM